VPQVIPLHVALRTALKDSVTSAIGLNIRLELLIAVKGNRPTERYHGKVDHSQPPWNAQVAHTVLDLHARAREMEAWLRLSQQLPSRPRGGSSGNTSKALQNVARLCEAAADDTVRQYTRELDRWIRNAKVALDEVEMPKRLPRSPGCPEPKCPWCQNHTLRMWPLAGKIFCIAPDCRDEENRKPSARLEYSPHVGDLVLVWMDGLSGVPA
jgi:hypothetical protein